MATLIVAIFHNETHYEFFTPYQRIIEKNHHNLSRETLIDNVKGFINKIDLECINQYEELNEFGDLITVLYAKDAA